MTMENGTKEMINMLTGVAYLIGGLVGVGITATSGPMVGVVSVLIGAFITIIT